jgi:hypothetical protein
MHARSYQSKTRRLQWSVAIARSNMILRRASTFLSWVMITSFRAVGTSMARSVAGTLASSLAIAPSTRRCSFRDEVVLPGCSPFEVGEWFLATDASVPLASAGFRFLLCLLDVFRALTFLPPFLELGFIYRSRWSQPAVSRHAHKVNVVANFYLCAEPPSIWWKNDRSVSHLFSPVRKASVPDCLGTEQPEVHTLVRLR